MRESQIVGFFEDVMQLGGALFASFRDKYNTRGILFLKDKFIYNKGFLGGKSEMPYESIRFVERSLASTVIYTGRIKEDGTKETLKLSGISFEESQPISCLMEELRNLNEDTIEVTKWEKYQDKGKKILNFVLDTVSEDIAKVERIKRENKRELEDKKRKLEDKKNSAENILQNKYGHSKEEIQQAEEILSKAKELEEREVKMENYMENYKEMMKERKKNQRDEYLNQ